nr:hypothetical protein [Thermoanaerobaculia bacterium]
MSAADLASLAPELVLTGAGILLLLLEAFLPAFRRVATPFALLSTVVAGWAATGLVAGRTFGGQLETSPVTLVFTMVVLVATALTVAASEGFLRRERIPAGEYLSLLLWCAVGILLMLRATELLTIFVCLELFSICLYSLAAFHRQIA